MVREARRLPDGDTREDDEARLRSLYPEVWQQLMNREDLRGKYVLLESIGDRLSIVRGYDVDPPVDILTMEQGLIIVKVPDASEQANTFAQSNISGETRWRIREIAKEFGGSGAVLREDGLLFVPDDQEGAETGSQIRPDVEKWDWKND